MVGTTPYLTASSQWLPDPSQIVSDFTFAQAPDDEAFQLVTYDDTYFLPGDVGALLILLLVGAGGWLGVRLLRVAGSLRWSSPASASGSPVEAASAASVDTKIRPDALRAHEVSDGPSPASPVST